MTDVESCFVVKLSHYIDINDEQAQLLAKLEKDERQVAEGEEVYSDGDQMERLFVVRSGWLYGYNNLTDGGRHVVRIYHPGDIIGFPMLAFSHHSVNLCSATTGSICPFLKKDLDEVFINAPRIAALLLTLAAREQVVLIDTLRAASRMNPRSRIAFFLLNLVCRLRVTNKKLTNRFRLPLNQSIIGDSIGLTNVTVSRTLVEMEQEGLLERDAGDILLHKESELRNLCDYQDRYIDMDTSWFPIK